MEHYITCGKTKIWTTIHDERLCCKKPFLLMCGAGPGVNDGLNEVDPLLNMHFNTIRFNHRGCGTSTADKNYKIETVLEDIESIRKYYKIKKWHILGHSWGANIALFYALKNSKNCNSIIYLCGLGVQNDRDWSEKCAKSASEETEEERPPRINIDDTMNYDVLNAEISSFNKYIQKPMLLKEIATLQNPVYVICSRKDGRPIWPSVQLSNFLPKGELIIFEESGHFPWLSHPNLVRDTIFMCFSKNQ